VSAPATGRILVVCSGNICRSPYAAAYLQRRLAAMGVTGIEVHSAGTLGILSSPPSPETLRLAQADGLDLSSHRSQGLSFEQVDEADIILVMEEAHRAILTERFPECRGRVHLLSEFHPSVRAAAAAPDIFDPIGMPLTDYRRCFALLRDAADGFQRARYPGRE